MPPKKTTKCLHCGKDVHAHPGKRQKKFCSDSCRSSYRQKKTRGTLSNSNKKDGKKKVEVKDLTKAKEVKPVSDPKPKTNYSIDTTGKDKSSVEKTSDYLLQRRRMKQ